MERSSSQISKSLEDQRLMLRIWFSPHLEDISPFVEIRTLLFTSIQDFQMQLLGMDQILCGALRIKDSTCLQSKEREILSKSTKTCKNTKYSTPASKLKASSVEDSFPSRVKNSSLSTTGKAKSS